MKTIEMQLAEALAKIATQDAAIKTLTESNTAFQKTAAQATLAKLLTESKLPKASQAAITKQFAEAVDDKLFAETISYHETLVKEIAGVTVKNLGAVTEAAVTDAQKAKRRVALVESYVKLGMSKEAAEKAADESKQ